MTEIDPRQLDIADPAALEALEEIPDIVADDWLLIEGELPEDGFPEGHPTCPPPTKWHQTAMSVKAKGSWVRVSSRVWAKDAAVRHTFRVERSVTWGASVEESLKGSLKLIEMELKIKLDTHVTLTTSETFAYTVPKGKAMALFAAPAYVVRGFERTAYSSAGPCYPVRQSCRVRSPYAYTVAVMDS